MDIPWQKYRVDSVKGARYMPKILSDKTARVQRIVRQN